MVKVSNKVLLAGGLATAIGISGCKKYDDGPMFSLLTKKQRLTGEWEVKKFRQNGVNAISQGLELEMEFDKDGDFEFTARSTYTDYYGYSYNYTNKVTGEWEFSNDKEEVELDYDDSDISDEEWEITRLTNKELEGDITQTMKKKLFPELELASKSSIRIEAEKQ